ncbi:hypothetical protein LEA_19739 [human gut metagenome]|uniref:AbiJ-NTD3 domain-containing protein n=1 Tax=human gut metagenome TaxID=408170 RepID=K1SH31_9ZZZZ
MPSFDSRFANAEQDIWQHTVNNDDYPYCWVFEDKRFNLQDGSDEVYLKFLFVLLIYTQLFMGLLIGHGQHNIIKKQLVLIRTVKQLKNLQMNL